MAALRMTTMLEVGMSAAGAAVLIWFAWVRSRCRSVLRFDRWEHAGWCVDWTEKKREREKLVSGDKTNLNEWPI